MKNKIITLTITGFICLSASSCNISMPTSNVTTEKMQPSVIFNNPQSKAIIYVDGVQTGLVKEYSQKPLALEGGIHLLRIVDDNKTIFEQKIFLSGKEIKKINLN